MLHATPLRDTFPVVAEKRKRHINNITAQYLKKLRTSPHNHTIVINNQVVLVIFLEYATHNIDPIQFLNQLNINTSREAHIGPLMHTEHTPKLAEILPGRTPSPGLQDVVVLGLHGQGHQLVDIETLQHTLAHAEDSLDILGGGNYDAHLVHVDVGLHCARVRGAYPFLYGLDLAALFFEDKVFIVAIAQ